MLPTLCLAFQGNNAVLKGLLSAWMWFGSIGFGLLYLAYLCPPSHSWVTFIGGRFCGLALNPNQTALYLSVLPLLWIGRGRKGWLPALWLTAAGFATGSDTLTVGWAVAATGLAFCPGDSRKWGLAYLACFLGLLLASPSQSGSDLYTSERRQENVSTRWSLVRNAWPAIAARPWLGHGPGAYSFEDGQPQYAMEAHNSWVDWTTNAGLLGLMPIAILMVGLGAQRVRQRQPVPLAMFVTLLFFASFHYTFRQPIYWIYLLLIGQWTSTCDETRRLPP